MGARLAHNSLGENAASGVTVLGDADGLDHVMAAKGISSVAFRDLTPEGTAKVLAAIARGVIPKTVQRLEMLKCWHLLDWPPAASAGLPRGLRILRIVGSRLSSAPDLSDAPATLEELDLHDNQIGPGLPPDRWLPPGVASMDLSYNKIHAVEAAGWKAVATVAHVDVSFNFLTVPPPAGRQAGCTYHHNNIDVRRHGVGNYTLSPATGRWTNTRTGDGMVDAPLARPLVRAPATGLWTSDLTGGDVTVGAPWDENARNLPLRRREPVQVQVQVQVHTRAYTGEQNVHGPGVQKGAKDAVEVVLRLSARHPWLSVNSCIRQARAALYPRRSLAGWLLGALRALLLMDHDRDNSHDLEAWCRDPAVFYHQTAGITYGALFERVWSIVEHQEDREIRDTLRQRLKEEVAESRGMCFTGRVTRLINALQGVVPGVHVGVSAREALQARASSVMARLTAAAAKPPSDAAAAVLVLRKELEEAIDECDKERTLSPGEREAWLGAFDDARPLLGSKSLTPNFTLAFGHPTSTNSKSPHVVRYNDAP